MAAITYKCFNCGGQLEFRPAQQKLQCAFCRSTFTEEEIARLSQAEADRRAAVAQANNSGAEADPQQVNANLYNCPTCGAEIVADETTAATSCYYCHNPVVLSGRLSGDFQPQYVIPFAIEREKAVSGFLDWVRRKKFVPKNFFSPDQIANVSGVYFPYWMVDSDVNASLEGRATKVRSWTSGDVQYTETKYYNVRRAGNIAIKDLPRNALDKPTRALADSVIPFDMKGARVYQNAYLSGFLAEKRNIEIPQFQQDVEREVTSLTDTTLRSTVAGYSSLQAGTHVQNIRSQWKYTLLPVWLLTYGIQKEKINYYALNGQTGKVRGVLPLSYGKLFFVSLLIALAAVTMGLLLGYFL